MIAKLVEKKKGKSSYTRLVSYLTDPQGNPNRVLHVRSTNLVNDQVSIVVKGPKNISIV